MRITEFLLARIAEDEAVARASTPGPWHVDSDTYAETISSNDGTAVVAGGRWGGEASVFDSSNDALHITRWNPKRVLAACEAKRRILELHRHRPAGARDPHDFGCEVCDYDRDYDVLGNGWCDTLRALASEYADHPDYREEWRP